VIGDAAAGDATADDDRSCPFGQIRRTAHRVVPRPSSPDSAILCLNIQSG
jgi:hypothetical protein